MKPPFGKPRAADAGILAAIRSHMEAVNHGRFGGTLPTIPVYLNGRLTRALAYLWAHDDTCKCGRRRRPHAPEWFAFSRSWVAQASPEALRDLVTHEMIHLWQATQRKPVDHGPEFKAKGHEVGLSRFWCRA